MSNLSSPRNSSATCEKPDAAGVRGASRHFGLAPRSLAPWRCLFLGIAIVLPACHARDAEYYAYRGEVRLTKGEHDKAIADFNEAIRLDRDYAYAYDRRGIVWQDMGEYDEAIIDYSEALRIYPRYPPAYCGRGHAWAKKGDYDKAASDYNRALAVDPKYAPAYEGLSWL
jgi:tetratricopeptide (TPR) repeat protein